MKDEPQSTWSCDTDINKVLAMGITVTLPFVWSHRKKGLTPSRSFSIILDKPTTLKDALILVENKATEYVIEKGADGLRHYYIEKVATWGDEIIFIKGT